MKTKSICLSGTLSALGVGALLFLGVGYTSIANAAQGCGFGNHMTAYGRCIPNSPGPWSTAAPGRPDCWYNRAGQLRCYR